MQLKNHFLMAMPSLAGSYFGQSLIYLTEHTYEGALGLVVNKPSGATLADVFEQLNIPVDEPIASEPVLAGGPVQTESGFILHSDDVVTPSSSVIRDGLALSTDTEMLTALAAAEGPARYLLAFGFAGWGPGQLETEIGENAWLTCPGDTSILFDTPFEARLDAAARSLGIDFALMAPTAGRA